MPFNAIRIFFIFFFPNFTVLLGMLFALYDSV